MFKKYWIAYYLIFVLWIISFIGCKKEEVKDLTAEEKIIFDSLKIIAFKDIRSHTDTICSRVQDSLFNTYVDSLLTLRMGEIQQLFEDTQHK
jgi:hypothetical protein